MITQREYLVHVNSKTLLRLSQNLSKMIKLTERMSLPIQIWLKSVNEGLLDKKRKYIFFLIFGEKVGTVHGFLHD